MIHRARIELTISLERVPDHKMLGDFVDRIVKAIEMDDDVRIGKLKRAVGDPFIDVDVRTQEA